MTGQLIQFHMICNTFEFLEIVYKQREQHYLPQCLKKRATTQITWNKLRRLNHLHTVVHLKRTPNILLQRVQRIHPSLILFSPLAIRNRPHIIPSSLLQQALLSILHLTCMIPKCLHTLKLNPITTLLCHNISSRLRTWMFLVGKQLRSATLHREPTPNSRVPSGSRCWSSYSVDTSWDWSLSSLHVSFPDVVIVACIKINHWNLSPDTSVTICSLIDVMWCDVM